MVVEVDVVVVVEDVLVDEELDVEDVEDVVLDVVDVVEDVVDEVVDEVVVEVVVVVVMLTIVMRPELVEFAFIGVLSVTMTFALSVLLPYNEAGGVHRNVFDAKLTDL